MAVVELGLWWLASSAAVFGVLYPLSRLWGARAPRLFQGLWLVFFLKLIVPVGVWSPFPAPPPPLAAITQPASNVDGLVNGDSSVPLLVVKGPSSPPSPEAPWSLVGWWALALVWVAGTLVAGALSVRAYLRSLSDPELGPALVGVFRPRIVLPADFEWRFAAEERELILAHEREHLRFGDHLWFAFVQATVCLFWWVPFVWWARAEFQTVAEMGCDQAVLSRPLAKAQVYGQLMLRLATGQPRSAGQGFAARFGGLKRRLTAVMGPRRWGGLGLAAVAVVLVGGLGAASLVPQASDWQWPLPDGPSDNQALLVPFSDQLDDFGGLVLSVMPGTPVRAASDGYVVELGGEDEGLGAVALEHGNGYRTRYARIDVDPELILGRQVRAGQVLGVVHRLKAGASVTDERRPALWFGVQKEGRPLDPSRIFARAAWLAAPDFLPQPLFWPLPSHLGRETTPFGVQTHPFTGQFFFHRGIDWAVPLGTEVFAVAGGVVSKVDYEPLGMGWYVEVDHGKGRLSLYGHLAEVASGLERGQSIVAGQVVGRAGASGLATGPHLHWELVEEGRILDPLRVTYRP